jgi:hypothetical protein
VLGIGVIALLAGEISYIHPGPAIAVGLLVIVVLLTGLAINDSQAKLSRKVHELQAENRELSRTIEQLQEEPTRSLPFVIGLDVLVEHWMKLSTRNSATMYEQLWLAQRIFNKPDIREITFLKRFPGHKPERSAFLVQPQDREAQVLKFDRIGNLRKERERIASCVTGKISRYVPGRPVDYWPPESEWTRLSDDQYGAVIYELAQLRSAAPLTFGQYYAQKDTSSVVNVLNKIHEKMAPTEMEVPGKRATSEEKKARAWWDRLFIGQYEKDECPPTGKTPAENGLFFEYKRLKNKLDKMKQGWQEACENPNTSTAFQQYLSSRRSLPDPLEWVRQVFDSPDSFSAKYGHLDTLGTRRDSIVHGDFHGGNILIEDGDEPTIWLIDFPHTHIGPTVQDIARLEADIKFGLFSEEVLANSFDQLLEFENSILGDSARQSLDLSTKPTPQWHGITASAAAEFDKAWCALTVLRRPVREHYLHGRFAHPYHLALLHATLPVLYYQNYSAQQKLYAFIAAAMLCERLSR